MRPTNRSDNIIAVEIKSANGRIAIDFEYPIASITEPNTKLNPISKIEARETTIVVALALIELGTKLFERSVNVGYTIETAKPHKNSKGSVLKAKTIE